MLIAQISDPHVTTEGTAVRSLVDTPARLVEAFESCAALATVPDVILLTGDLVNDATPEEYEVLASTLAHAPCPILPIPGNHDDHVLLRATFAASDTCLVDLPDPAAGPFHYAVDDHDVRFVALDSTVPGLHNGEITEASAAWLDATLSERPEHPTIVFMHHTPYPTGAWWFDYNGVLGADRLRAVAARHPQLLRIVSGHVHRATSTQWGALTVSSAPSTAYLSGPVVEGGAPLIIDQRAPVTLFDVRGTTVVASETDLPLPHFTLDLRDLSRDWAAYEPAARAGGPISKSDFD
ncbi:MAG: phosphodiesterase [Acidimicrobiales bacterium]